KLVSDVTRDLDKAVGSGTGFAFIFDAELLKSKKPALVGGWSGEFVAYELGPDQTRGLNVPKKNLLSRQTGPPTGRPPGTPVAHLSDLTGDKAQDLDGGKNVTGTVTCKWTERRPGNYALRLTAVKFNGTLTSLHPLGEGDAPADGPVTFSFAPLNTGTVHAGPLLVFVELCSFADADRQGPAVLESNTVGALVNVAPGGVASPSPSPGPAPRP